MADLNDQIKDFQIAAGTTIIGVQLFMLKITFIE